MVEAGHLGGAAAGHLAVVVPPDTGARHPSVCITVSTVDMFAAATTVCMFRLLLCAKS